MYCEKCGSEISKHSRYCTECGAKIQCETKNNKAEEKINWICTVLIAIMLIILFIGLDDKYGWIKKKEDISSQGARQDKTLINTEGIDSGNNILKKIHVGSSFEKDGLRITLNEADTNFQDYSNEYGWNTPPSGMKYIMVSFTFENNGKDDEYVSIYDFDCYADNMACEQVYTLDDNNFINTNLSQGRNISFKTYYIVPINAQSIELEYETDIWTGEKVIMEIQ